MKKIIILGLLIAGLRSFAVDAPWPTFPNSVWYYQSNDLQVLGHSPYINSQCDSLDLFGATNTTLPSERGGILFRDFQPSGSVHWVEWTARTNIIRNITICIRHDDDIYTTSRRGAKRIRIMDWNDSSELYDNLLVDFYLPSPIYNPDRYANLWACMEICSFPISLPSFRSRFRIEITQVDAPDYGYEGPRMAEIAAFTNAIPFLPSLDAITIGETNYVQCSYLVKSKGVDLLQASSIDTDSWNTVVGSTTATGFGYRFPLGPTNNSSFFRVRTSE